MHAGVPAYCLGDYFRLLLSRRRLDPGLDAEELPGLGDGTRSGDAPVCSWTSPPGDSCSAGATTPTTSWTARSTCSTGSRSRTPTSVAVGLPGYMIEAAKAELAAGHLDLSGIGRRRAGGQGAMTIGRQVQPRIALDPYGQGVHVLLPAVGEMPAGVARWRITADGDTHTVHSRAMWVGAAGTTPQTACPLDKPVTHGARLTRRPRGPRHRTPRRRPGRPRSLFQRGRPPARGYRVPAPRPGLDHPPGRPGT